MTKALGIASHGEDVDAALKNTTEIRGVETGRRDQLPPHHGLARGTSTMTLVRAGGRRSDASALSRVDQVDALAPLLLTSPLLLGLNTTQLRQLCDASTVVRYEASQTIYRHGDETTAVFLVIDGTVDVQSANSSFREPGELVGEMGILSSARRFGFALADSAATLLSVPPSLIRSFFRSGSSALAGVHSVIVEQLAIAALGHIGLGRGLDLSTMVRLARHCALQCFVGGDCVDEPGTDREGIYVVVSGMLSSTEAYGQRAVVIEKLCEGAAFRLSRTSARILRAQHDGWLLRLDRQAVSDIVLFSSGAQGEFIGFV